VRDATRDAFVSRLSDCERVVELGIGRSPAIARELAAVGVAVTATDIRDCQVPAGVSFVRDDFTDPDRAVYAGADALYARNLPPELQCPAHSLSRAVDARLLFSTLGGDPAVVPVRRESTPATTLFVAQQPAD